MNYFHFFALVRKQSAELNSVIQLTMSLRLGDVYEMGYLYNIIFINTYFCKYFNTLCINIYVCIKLGEKLLVLFLFITISYMKTIYYKKIF